uniref:Uncharacterized protein n=1 Tax=Rhizophora mucronata TaxID=61149 RepID=A0A2P2J0A9_RHIMU
MDTLSSLPKCSLPLKCGTPILAVKVVLFAWIF